MYKFHFYCQQCNEEFNVELNYMLKKESIVCPNCSNTLPEDVFCHLKSVVTSLDEYRKAEINQSGEAKHFSLTIQ